MKKIVLSLLVLFAASVSQASFFDNCEVKVKVVELGELHEPLENQTKYAKELKFQIIEAKSLGGHTDCQHLVTNLEVESLVHSAAVADLAAINVGDQIVLNYYSFNSLTPEGIIGGTTYTLKSLAQEVLALVHQNSEVSEKIEKLKIELSIANMYGKVLAETVQILPGSMCGFAGCESNFVVAITVGIEGKNYPQQTLIIKASHISALGLYTLTIL